MPERISGDAIRRYGRACESLDALKLAGKPRMDMFRVLSIDTTHPGYRSEHERAIELLGPHFHEHLPKIFDAALKKARQEFAIASQLLVEAVHEDLSREFPPAGRATVEPRDA